MLHRLRLDCSCRLLVDQEADSFQHVDSDTKVSPRLEVCNDSVALGLNIDPELLAVPVNTYRLRSDVRRGEQIAELD